MDFSMFEDLPDMQRFLRNQNVTDSMNDLMETIGGMTSPADGKNNVSNKADELDNINGKAGSNVGKSGRFPKNTPIAMAYVPKQEWGKTYNDEKGFGKGTVFPELDLPFAPEEGCYDTER